MNPLLFTSLLMIVFSSTEGQGPLAVTDPSSGLRLSVLNKELPLLKILLPGQPDSERGIEIEFPEHVTGVNKNTGNPDQLYLISRGNRNRWGAPVWQKKGNTISYETDLPNNIHLVARVELDSDGVHYAYTFTNRSGIVYHNFQAPTCIKLYSVFSDTLLQRTYVHHPGGFELLASETPERLSMPLNQWLPCRYLVSYTWPVPKQRMEKDGDGITRYYKSKKTDLPLIATLSHDKKWVAVTCSKDPGNLWTNPERTCHHADMAVDLNTGETKTISFKTFIYKGGLDRSVLLFKQFAARDRH